MFVNVREPFINTEEKIDRFVGRRTRTPDPLSMASDNQADARAWRKALGGVRVPKGVHRFATHEEADEWLWRTIACLVVLAPKEGPVSVVPYLFRRRIVRRLEEFRLHSTVNCQRSPGLGFRGFFRFDPIRVGAERVE